MSDLTIAYIRLDQIKHLPNNPKDHDVGAIVASIAKYGFISPMGINVQTGNDINGNGRLDALRAMKPGYDQEGKAPPKGIKRDSGGMWLVPVVEGIDIAPEQELDASIAINRVQEIGGWHVGKLAHALEVIAESGRSLESTGYDKEQLDSMLQSIAPPEAKKEKPLSPIDGAQIGGIQYWPKFNKKRSIRFLSIRRWNLKTKESDLATLKKVKSECPAPVVNAVAGEIAEVLKTFLTFTANPLIGVTHPPRGASAGQFHFATEIARVVAEQLGAQYFEAFESRAMARTSHPRNFAERGELKALTWPALSMVILIDDIATSGTTLETCAHLLGVLTPVIPVAWIYEDTEG